MIIFFRTKCREIAQDNSIILPKKTFGENALCQKCSLSWREGQFDLDLHNKILRKNNEIKTKCKKKKTRRKINVKQIVS